MKNDEQEKVFALPVDAGRFIPHRHPIRFIDRLLKCTEDSAEAEAIFMTENVLTDVDESIDPVIFVELMAQTYAALAGYLGAKRGKPVKKGFLVAVRDLEITGRLSVGDRAVVRVETGTIFGAFAVVSGKILRDEIQLAAANLKLWMPDDPDGLDR